MFIFSKLLSSARHLQVFHLGEGLYLAGQSVLGETPGAGRLRLRMRRQLCCLASYMRHTSMLNNIEHTGFGQRPCMMDNPEKNN